MATNKASHQNLANGLLAHLLNILYVLCSTHFRALNQGHFSRPSASAGSWSCMVHTPQQEHSVTYQTSKGIAQVEADYHPTANHPFMPWHILTKGQIV